MLISGRVSAKDDYTASDVEVSPRSYMPSWLWVSNLFYAQPVARLIIYSKLWNLQPRWMFSSCNSPAISILRPLFQALLCLHPLQAMSIPTIADKQNILLRLTLLLKSIMHLRMNHFLVPVFCMLHLDAHVGGSSKIQNFMSHDSSPIKIEVYSNGRLTGY